MGQPKAKARTRMQSKSAIEPDVETRRHEAADKEWIAYDLGNAESCGQSGWEWTTPSDRMTRQVYLDLRTDEPSTSATLTVTFQPGTAIVVSAQVAIDGNSIGCRGTTGDRDEP
jgi:hypothetical protein